MRSTEIAVAKPRFDIGAFCMNFMYIYQEFIVWIDNIHFTSFDGIKILIH